MNAKTLLELFGHDAGLVVLAVLLAVAALAVAAFWQGRQITIGRLSIGPRASAGPPAPRGRARRRAGPPREITWEPQLGQYLGGGDISYSFLATFLAPARPRPWRPGSRGRTAAT